MSISVRILLISLSGDDLVPTVSCVIRSVFNNRIRKERCRVLTLAMVDDTACNDASQQDARKPDNKGFI